MSISTDSPEVDFDIQRGQRVNVLRYGVVALLLLTFLVFCVRLFSVITFGSLFTSTGIEEAPIYSVWKVVHQDPLYESPLSGYYGLGLYNWLFYTLYGSLIRSMGLDGSALILAGRLITLAFTVLGCVGFRLVLSRVAPRLTPAWAWMLSVLVWADAGEAGWWQVSVRPDFAALAAATWAFWFWIGAIRDGRTRLALAASLLFYAAWSFKQTTVLLFVACCLVVLLAQRWKVGFAALAIPFGVLVAATFVVGGHNYYLNTIYAPSINAFVAEGGIAEIARALLASPFLWIGGIVGFSALLSGKVVIGGRGPFGSPIAQALLLGYLLTIVGDCLGICRSGSVRNTLFEAFLVSAVLTCVVVSDILIERIPPMSGRVWNKILLTAALANVMILGGRLCSIPGLGRLMLASRDEFSSRLSLATFMNSMPSPVFIREGILSLPWHANKNNYPAIMDDFLFYEAALRRGALTEYPVQQLIASHHFHTLLVTQQDPAFGWALEAGCTLNASQTFSRWSLTQIDCTGSNDTGRTHRE
jgi:hypothetical protein